MINHFPCNQLTIFFPRISASEVQLPFFTKTIFLFFTAVDARPKGQKAELPWLVLISLGQTESYFFYKDFCYYK